MCPLVARWMDIAQPGFEPRACRDIGELSYFEKCIVTPLPVKSMLRAVCTVAHTSGGVQA